MGTSKSYGGPTDSSPLLPAWAQNPEATNPGGVSQDPPSSTGTGAPASVAPDGDSATPPDSEDDETPAPGAVVSSSTQPWRTAKIRLGKAAQSGSRVDLRSAGTAYTHARGGARAASGAARGGRKATASLAGFFAGVASTGIRTALQRAGLAQYVGRDHDQVFAAIVNALAPAGSSTEEAAARHAAAEVLEELYTQFAVVAGGLERLNAMTADDVRAAIELSIAKYIYHRWLGELSQRLEEKSVSAAQAERLEREMKTYVREIVQLDLTSINVLQLDWNGPQGARLLEELYEQAYGILGAAGDSI